MIVVLVEPQIPQNTGNALRTCAVTGSKLVLVEPLGFSISSKHLKRAGLDYWDGVDVQVVPDLNEFLEKSEGSLHFFSSKAAKWHTEATFSQHDLLIFGSETKGLPPFCLQRWPSRFIKIPMIPGVRCLNLATSVGIGVYEAWRQQNFCLPSGLSQELL